MAILLLLIVILAGLVAVDAVIENPDPASVTIAGQQLGGLPLGGWLAAFAVLGFIAAYLLLGGLATARRRSHRRREQRAREREMAQRVAELEQENVALREPDDQPDDRPPTSEWPADAPTDAAGGGAVTRDDHGRRLSLPGAPHAAGPRHNHTATPDPTAPRHSDDQRPRDPVDS